MGCGNASDVPPVRRRSNNAAQAPHLNPSENELDKEHFDALVASELDGSITDEQLLALEADPERWLDRVYRLLTETEEWLETVRRSTRDERDQALTDLTEERDRLTAVVRYLTGQDEEDDDAPDGAPDDDSDEDDDVFVLPDVPQLQASWLANQVVLWAGNPSAVPADRARLDELIAEAGAAAVGWSPRRGVPLPTEERAAATTAPVEAALGWLVGVGAGQLATDAGQSVRWLGEVAVWATELVALGRMVPTLQRTSSSSGKGAKQRTGSYAVEWMPSVVDNDRLRDLASRMPGPVIALDTTARPEKLCRSVLGAAVDAVCRVGAGRLVAAATPPVIRTRRDLSEAVLAGLNGAPFTAPQGPAGELADDLRRWAAPVLNGSDVRLTVTLDPPEDDGGWLLHVHASGIERQPLPVDRALAVPARAKAEQVEAHLSRLERLVPALGRTRRRGHVVLQTEEAWDLLTRSGTVLAAAGFEVRVPAMSRKRPAPRLRLEAEESGPSKVGPNQLSKVRWSVLFDDVELDGPAIARLSAQARPLVRAKGRWVELDHADLAAAARALAERATTTELTGAAILRHAVGLEDSPLAGAAVVDGRGWAVDLVRGATTDPPKPLATLEGFAGDLRTYQAEARGWLEFLDRVGLGGCLAMDMGLGKTPTVLAHLLANRGDGPALVIAPPAVLGNWAAEAARFTPELSVHVHHGGSRADGDELANLAGKTDVVATTYATAVRDIEALEAIEWQRVVLDEAQAIKNPASEAARELRRIPARSRLALTGTPIENGLGDLWAILDFTNPGLVGPRPAFVKQLSSSNDGSSAPGEAALRALNGLLVFRRTKSEPEIAAELPDLIEELDRCGMTPEQIGLYQAVLDDLLGNALDDEDAGARKGQVLAAITALKQICDHPAAYLNDDTGPLEGRSGKLTRLNELVDAVFDAGERVLVFTHFARWGERLAEHLTERTGVPVACYHGGLSRGVRDRLISEFQAGTGAGALVLSIKAGGSGLNLTAANHVVLYDRWWNPAVEDQARDRAWRIGQDNAVVSHRLVCPGTVDEQVEEIVAGKRRMANLVLPSSSSVGDLTPEQLRAALGLRPETLLEEASGDHGTDQEGEAA
jgi:superfamily II DNA or RNA helicase